MCKSMNLDWLNREQIEDEKILRFEGLFTQYKNLKQKRWMIFINQFICMNFKKVQIIQIDVEKESASFEEA